MLLFVLLLSLVSLPSSSGLDFTDNVLEYVNFNTSACDDFYRHACPLSTPKSPRAVAVHRMIGLNVKPPPSLKLRLASDYHGFKILNTNSWTPFEKFSQSYLNLCEAKGNTAHFLKVLETVLHVNGRCIDRLCLIHLQGDSDCGRAAAYINRAIQVYDNFSVVQLSTKFFEFATLVHDVLLQKRFVDIYLALNLTQGFEEMSDMLEEFKKETAEQIAKTPWAQNEKMTQLVETVLSRLYLDDDFQEISTNIKKTLTAMNEVYEDCRKPFNFKVNDAILMLCSLYTQKSFENVHSTHVMSVERAGIVYPSISFGYTWYYMLQHSENKASKLGNVGMVLAHELSHSVIQGTKDFDVLPYFSEPSRKCVMNQYKSTWNEFHEDITGIREYMFEENGADVLGFSIIYSILDKYYNGKQFETPYNEKIENVAQLFFYSAAFALCSGKQNPNRGSDPHAPTNVRINALVNHPAFQHSFQCPDDSRMMKTQTERCVIYGEDAPQQRRRFRPEN